MGTTKAERKYGSKPDKVVKTQQRKKKEKIEAKTIRIMKDKANFIRETFSTMKEAQDYIKKAQARDKESFILSDYQIV